MEDIDTARCRPTFEAAFLEDLAWLGLDWEVPVRRQSEHRADYRAALERLQARGLVYRDFRGRRQMREGAPTPASEDGPFAWRLSLDAAQAGLARSLTPAERAAGDVVLARKDLGVAYHLAVVVDDALQGVTHVIRGADLEGAAPIHRLLQSLLGLPTPTYRHHPLLLREDGKKFAKRDTAETLRDLRERGVTAAALRDELGF